jgi:RNA polymerase sigma-70 factor (ECF subfamily)
VDRHDFQWLVSVVRGKPAGPLRWAPVIDDLLAAFVAQAAQTWPRFDAPLDEFRERVRAQLPDAPETALRALQGAEMYLVFACLKGDEAAWRELDRTYLSKVPRYVAALDRSPAFGAEVRQRLSAKLAGATSKLAQYTGRGPLDAWLRVAAVREAHSLRRRAKRTVDPDDVALRASASDPEMALLRRRSAKALESAFAEVITALPADDRTLLRMHFIDGLTIDEVGKAFRVSRASAGRLLLRARERILRRVERALREELGPGAPGPRSLLALVGSQIDVSIVRYFKQST